MLNPSQRDQRGLAGDGFGDLECADRSLRAPEMDANVSSVANFGPNFGRAAATLGMMALNVLVDIGVSLIKR